MIRVIVYTDLYKRTARMLMYWAGVHYDPTETEDSLRLRFTEMGRDLSHDSGQPFHGINMIKL